MTLIDVRVLCDHLLSNDDRNNAAYAYAHDHMHYYRTIHIIENWLSELLMSMGPDADSRRDRALSLIAEDPTMLPDHIFCCPELPADEQVRRRLFGEI